MVLTEQQKNSKIYYFGVREQQAQASDLYNAFNEDPQLQQVYTNSSKTPALVIFNVSKNYQTKDRVIAANKSVNLIANKGEIVGILGPNGSGKSTLCKAIMMTHKIDSGDILIN